MPRPKRNGPAKTLNLKVDDKLRKRMERLRDKTEAGSLSELVRRAISVYEFVAAARANGERVVIGDREIVVL